MACLASAVHAIDSPLRINECMAANSSTIADPQSEYDDWIEIYNTSRIPIDMAGMYLSDDPDEPGKWRIPADRSAETTVPAQGFLLIWADGDTEDEPGLHAPFSLSARGEDIVLLDIDGATPIDTVTFGEQASDISFGRYPDGADAWHSMSQPTPGGANVKIYEGFVDDVQFSPERGFYEAPVLVTLTTATPETTIYYTTDGSEPYVWTGRAYRGTRYTKPIEIDETTCLKAKAIRSDWKPSTTRTHTYIFADQVTQQRPNPEGFPPTWRGGAADYEMDPTIVRYPPYRDTVGVALLTHRTISLTLDVDDLFDPETGIYVNSQSEGEDWERPVSMEIIDPAGGAEIQVNAALRIQGGASRNPNRPKHNLRLLFKGQYGPTKLEFPLFEDWPIQRFDTIVLRGGNGDSWFHPNTNQQIRAQYIRDQWPRDTQRAMGRLSAGQCYVHLYLNGLYWGLYHAIERPNAAFFAEHLGGVEEEYDVVQHKGGTVDGNRNAWNAMMAIADRGLASADAYHEIQEYLDIPNLIDYLLVHFYAGNVDWDHNNWYGGRRRTGGDGFHFLSWDSERTFLNLNDNVTGKDNNNQPTHVHQRLTANADYRMQFADRVHRHFFNGGLLTPQNAVARWLDRAEEIRLALVAESARWGDAHQPDDPYTPDIEWQAELDFLTQEYFPRRSDIVLNQLRGRGLYPSVAAPAFSRHGGAVPTGFALEMTTPTGVTWFTTDGADPRRPAPPQSEAAEFTLVGEEALKHMLVPTEDIGDPWRQVLRHDLADWTAVEGTPGGIGYENTTGYEGYISADVHDLMYGSHTSCYVRISFTPETLADDWDAMTLGVRYDDGFVAYLNGTEIARRNFEGEPAWNSSAEAGHSDADAVGLEYIDVSAFLPLLRSDLNLLAIHALNVSAGSSDFLIGAELTAAIGGAPADVATTAQAYAGPIVLDRTAQVKARTLSAATWSALNEATFAVGPVVENLRITEIMYHPADDVATGVEPDAEFIEVANLGDVTIDLNLVRFTTGIDFVFGPTELAPGEAVIVVQDPNAFHSFYGDAINIAGQYAGKLDNGGERLRLEDAIGRTIVDFRYDDKWRRSTDGEGFSLVLIDPPPLDPNALGNQTAWRPSTTLGGSPGVYESTHPQF